MPRRIESLFLPGPAGKLEALLEEPEEGVPIEAALVCHPHPKGGGTMHNKVVYRLARGLRRTGSVVLRFNYRGVNLSEGEYDGGRGETEDARVALRQLRARYPDLPVTVAGFSFGSRIALRLASQEDNLRRVIAVGFPTKITGHDYVYHVTIPKYFIHSTHDEFGPREEFERFYSTVPEPKHLDWVPASDHFFKNALDQFEAVVERVGCETTSVDFLPTGQPAG
ncbi:MAG: alpha/beta fold hydrolase [Acidobacteriaceae bacterium]|nr:alpha/beta fold hydrolase [Acidobacteriaceae bacterium]